MSYFIFKDKHSDDMGITIHDLPLITKAPQKFISREFDGSDLIQIESLGFRPYEKTINIGLMDKNVDDVVSWLNGSGKLIMSNESDKYYNAHILNQVDYEKAIRFRIASIPFWIEPFKYSNEEEEIKSNTIFNQGNIECLPCITIYGNGTVNLTINNVFTCSVNVNGYITLDSQKQDAYKGNILQNRNMTGVFPVFSVGENTIYMTGGVTDYKIFVRSRWI